MRPTLVRHAGAARSARDATRFTATGPYVNRKGPTAAGGAGAGAASRAARFGPAPPGETPAEKVARLRRLAQQEREQVPRLEKVIDFGRRYADRVHRTFVMTIVTLSAIGTVYMLVVGTEMMLYNRRKRREWSAERESVKAKLLFEAQQAAKDGTATEEQITLLAQEREFREKQEEKIRARLAQKGIMTRMSELLVGDLKKEDDAAKKAKTEEGTVDVVSTASEQSQSQAASEAKGGLLDHLGEEAAQATTQKTKSWSDWIMRR